jgi:hypothetical protein
MKSKTATGNIMLMKARALLGMDPDSKEVTKHLSKRNQRLLRANGRKTHRGSKKAKVPTTSSLLKRSKSSDFKTK